MKKKWDWTPRNQKPPEERRVPVMVRILPESRDRLREICEELGISQSKAVDTALAAYVESKE